MDNFELVLLFDYYGDLLTERQKICFDLHYNQDLSLSEIANELSVSRQAVYDNLSRTEALLRNMEQKTGCVRRDLQMRKAMEAVAASARQLSVHPDGEVAGLAQKILATVQGLEE